MAEINNNYETEHKEAENNFLIYIARLTK